MKIRIEGTQVEVDTLLDQLDLVSLSMAGTGITLEVVTEAKKEAPKQPKTQDAVHREKLQRIYAAVGPEVKKYLACISDAGRDGKTEANIKSCLGKSNLGPMRRSLMAAAAAEGLDDLSYLLVEETVRKRKRWSLAPMFARIVSAPVEVTEAVTA